MAAPAPIPIPWRQRWRDVRQRFIPALLFIALLVALTQLWKNYASAPTLVGQAEVVPANVSSYKAGMLAQLYVNRFQTVKAGDQVGQVLVTDPKILASSLAVIQAEIEEMRASQTPVAAEQRLAMEYSEVRLHWMAQRAELGVSKADLMVAEADFHRTAELFKDKIVSERAYDLAKAKEESLRQKVDELTLSVEEQGRKIALLQPTNTTEISKVSDQPLQTAIAVEESKLHLTEAELSPITLRAAVDGMVDVIYHRVGEAVTVGEPIVGIAPSNAVRIIGYLRPPILDEPRLGASVEVRTRGQHRQVGAAKIIEVGTQFEALPPALQIPVRLANTELGLPLSISVPSSLKIRPGELVDLTLLPGTATLR
ncbi:MAG TPA: HlyD family efflux transporter periplasmic adaptor subunit [Verrucomicrobiae bacterium]|jgi:multidrug resistance efflux pump|nr:HlyD family efflux transporter periplasmic adaptor subunit [Verrucomicrobiae bacterium]